MFSFPFLCAKITQSLLRFFCSTSLHFKSARKCKQDCFVGKGNEWGRLGIFITMEAEYGDRVPNKFLILNFENAYVGSFKFNTHRHVLSSHSTSADIEQL